MELGVSLAQPNDGVHLPHRDGDRPRHGRLLSQLLVQRGNLVLIHVVQLWMHVLLGVEDVLLEQFLWDHVWVFFDEGVGFLLEQPVGVRALVVPHHKLCQPFVRHRVDHVLHHAENVESRNDGLCEVDVLCKRERRLVLSLDGVGGRDDGAPRLERGDDAGFGDRDGLLLHRLVDRGAVLVVHLVKLINQADALVGQHERAALERPLSGERVASHRGRQTDGRGALPGGEDRPRAHALGPLEELRLCGPGVAHHQHVDVPTHPHLVLELLGLTAKEREREGNLNVVVPKDRRRDRLEDAVGNVVLLRERSDSRDVLVGQPDVGKLVCALLHVVGFDDGRKDGKAVLRVERGVKLVAVDAGDLHLVARLDVIH
mmetsp:Transcript_32058/g.83970  ORF Transcript_32058/g.83970 Transcript_32058/m.83970 type:complete len:372 (+) Transcript_32058:804-1919(+)